MELIPNGHPLKPGLLNFGNSFVIRSNLQFQRVRELSDIEDALLILRDVVELSLHGHPHKPSRLNNFGNFFLGASETVTSRTQSRHPGMLLSSPPMIALTSPAILATSVTASELVLIPLGCRVTSSKQFSNIPGHKVSDFIVSSYVPTHSILTLSPHSSAPSSSDLCPLTVLSRPQMDYPTFQVWPPS